jgi:uncharacterized protein (DUF302 family)
MTERILSFTLVALLLMGAHAMAADGLISLTSQHGPKETMDRLESAVRAKGATVFARIDHAGGAQSAGLTLRPTELIVFGNAKGGTPLMQSQQTIGIDLPLKVLVWMDEAGMTRLAYNDPEWLARRHGLGSDVQPTLDALGALLRSVTEQAAQGQ